MPRHLIAAAARRRAHPPLASDAVRRATTFIPAPTASRSAACASRRCPGGRLFDKATSNRKRAYCAIDLYAPDVALCPKTWSTSPGMMVYDISDGPYAGDGRGFETRACKEGKSADLAADDLAKFKPTVNAKGTSGTFSASLAALLPLLALLRHGGVGVPVAVWRSMDAQGASERGGAAGPRAFGASAIPRA
jgi:hypothetical protein